jgi:hypothetical protein
MYLYKLLSLLGVCCAHWRLTIPTTHTVVLSLHMCRVMRGLQGEYALSNYTQVGIAKSAYARVLVMRLQTTSIASAVAWGIQLCMPAPSTPPQVLISSTPPQVLISTQHPTSSPDKQPDSTPPQVLISSRTRRLSDNAAAVHAEHSAASCTCRSSANAQCASYAHSCCCSVSHEACEHEASETHTCTCMCF